MRVSRKLDGKRCRRRASCRRMSRCVQTRRPRMRQWISPVHLERDQDEAHGAMPSPGPQSFDWPLPWMPQGGLTMTILVQVMSQYLRGDPMWDGPRTVAAMRNLVSGVR
jgi:hypothetical protein